MLSPTPPPLRRRFGPVLQVEIVEPMGSDTLVWIRRARQDFRFRMDGQAGPREGDRLEFSFDPAGASLFDKDAEERM